MYKRLVSIALADGVVTAAQIARFTDEGLLHALQSHASPEGRRLQDSLLARRLFKRAWESPAATLSGDDFEWIADDRPRTRAAESALAAALGVSASDVMLDFPAKTQMLSLDLPVLGTDGSVRRLTQAGLAGAIDLPKLSDDFYRTARWLRVFTAERVQTDGDRVLAVLRAS